MCTNCGGTNIEMVAETTVAKELHVMCLWQCNVPTKKGKISRRVYMEMPLQEIYIYQKWFVF